MKLTSVCAALILATLTATAVAQEPEGDDFKKLRGFLGTWEATGIEVEGAKIDVFAAWKPVLEGKFIEHRYMAVGDDADLRGIVMFGCDPADGKVRGWGFDKQGGYMAMELTGWDGDKSNWSTTFLAADGTTQKSEANSFEVIDKNSYGWMLAIAGGDTSEAVFHRVRPKKMQWPTSGDESGEDAAEQLRNIAWLTGNFEYRGTEGTTGKPSVGFATCGWVLDGKYLLYESASLDSELQLNRYRAIIGVDPATGKTVGREFSSSGLVGKYHISNDGHDLAGKAVSPDEGELNYEGKLMKTDSGVKYSSTVVAGEDKITHEGVWKRLK